MGRVLPLAGMMAIIWLTLIFGSALIPRLLFAATPTDSDTMERIAASVVRVAVSLVFVLVWLWLWKIAAAKYFWGTLKKAD